MNAAAYFIPAILVLMAALGGAIALKLHRPLIIGYALAGMVLAFLVPPFSLANLHTLDVMAQIEATLLMFWAGLELRFRLIVELKWIAIAIGILGTLFSIVLGLGTAYWLRLPAAQGLALGAATSLSSTIVLSANVDKDSCGIFTYSSAGAQFGYSLLWTMIPMAIALAIAMEIAARTGVSQERA